MAATLQGMAGVVLRLASKRPLHTPLVSAVSTMAKPPVQITDPTAGTTAPVFRIVYPLLGSAEGNLMRRVSGSGWGMPGKCLGKAWESLAGWIVKGLSITLRFSSETS